MSKPTLYYMIESAPCRLVMMVAKGIGIELNLVRVDLFLQQHLKSDYVSKNPFHTIPTLVDVDGFIVWESRAIAKYLIKTRAPESTLYPISDLKQRITIDKMLYYDAATLARAITDIVHAYKQGDPVEKIKRAREVLQTLNEYLATSSNFIANTNDDISLADLSLYVTLDYLDVNDIDLVKEFSHLGTWYQRVEGVVEEKYDPDGAIRKGRMIHYEKKIAILKSKQKHTYRQT